MAHVRLPTGGLETKEADAAGAAAFAALCETLMAGESGTVIGNAELVHCLRAPMPLLPCSLPTAAGPSLGDPAAAAELFHVSGVMAIKDAVAPSRLARLKPGFLQYTTTCLDALRLREKEGRGKHFHEIMQRDALRYDCRLEAGLLADTGVWELAREDGSWVPVVKELLGGSCKVHSVGCVFSLPGAGEQYWHSDGTHEGPAAGWADVDDPRKAAAGPHAVCVFVPLVELTKTNGYTEFWKGSQHFASLMDKKGEQTLPGGTDAIVGEGDAIVYDFRTVHRGMANSSQSIRPIMYVLYGHEEWEGDTKRNWGKTSVFEETKS